MTKFGDLPHDNIFAIDEFLDPESRHRFARTCNTVRHTIMDIMSRRSEEIIMSPKDEYIVAWTYFDHESCTKKCFMFNGDEIESQESLRWVRYHETLGRHLGHHLLLVSEKYVCSGVDIFFRYYFCSPEDPLYPKVDGDDYVIFLYDAQQGIVYYHTSGDAYYITGVKQIASNNRVFEIVCEDRKYIYLIEHEVLNLSSMTFINEPQVSMDDSDNIEVYYQQDAVSILFPPKIDNL